MPWSVPSSATTAFSLSGATGATTSTLTATFTNLSSGLHATASALAVGAAQSPSGNPKPAAATFVDASVPQGSIMIGSSMNIGANTGTFAFQAASLDVSALNLAGPFSSVNAPLS